MDAKLLGRCVLLFGELYLIYVDFTSKHARVVFHYNVSVHVVD